MAAEIGVYFLIVGPIHMNSDMGKNIFFVPSHMRGSL